MCTYYLKQGQLYFIVSILFFLLFFFLVFVLLFFFLVFFSFLAKGIYPVCDRVHLTLSFYMNLRIYIGDSSLFL